MATVLPSGRLPIPIPIPSSPKATRVPSPHNALFKLTPERPRRYARSLSSTKPLPVLSLGSEGSSSLISQPAQPARSSNFSLSRGRVRYREATRCSRRFMEPRLLLLLLNGGPFKELSRALKSESGRGNIPGLQNRTKELILQECLNESSAEGASLFAFVVPKMYSKDEGLFVLEKVYQSCNGDFPPFMSEYAFENLDTDINFTNLDDVEQFPCIAAAYYPNVCLAFTKLGSAILCSRDANQIKRYNSFLRECPYLPADADEWSVLYTQFSDYTDANVALDLEFCKRIAKHTDKNLDCIMTHVCKTQVEKLVSKDFEQLAALCIDRLDVAACKAFLASPKPSSILGVSLQKFIPGIFSAIQKESGFQAVEILSTVIHFMKAARVPINEDTLSRVINLADKLKDSPVGRELYVEVLDFATEFQASFTEDAMQRLEAWINDESCNALPDVLLPYIHYVESTLEHEITGTEYLRLATLMTKSMQSQCKALTEKENFVWEEAISGLLKACDDSNIILSKRQYSDLLQLVIDKNLDLKITKIVLDSVAAYNDLCRDKSETDFPEEDCIMIATEQIDAILCRDDLYDGLMTSIFTYCNKNEAILCFDVIKQAYSHALKVENDFSEGVFCAVAYCLGNVRAEFVADVDFFWDASLGTPKLTGIRSLIWAYDPERLDMQVPEERSQSFWKGLEAITPLDKMCRLLASHPPILGKAPILDFFDFIILKVQEESTLSVEDCSKKTYAEVVEIFVKYSNIADLDQELLSALLLKIDEIEDTHISSEFKERMLNPIWRVIIAKKGVSLEKDFVLAHARRLLNIGCMQSFNHVCSYLTYPPFNMEFEEIIELIDSVGPFSQDQQQVVEHALVSLCNQVYALNTPPFDVKRIEALMLKASDEQRWFKIAVLINFSLQHGKKISKEVLIKVFDEALDQLDEDEEEDEVEYISCLLSAIFDYAVSQKIELSENCEKQCFKKYMQAKSFKYSESVIKYAQFLIASGEETGLTPDLIHDNLFQFVQENELLFEENKLNQDVSDVMQYAIEYIAVAYPGCLEKQLQIIVNHWESSTILEVLKYISKVESSLKLDEPLLYPIDGVLYGRMLNCAFDGFDKAKDTQISLSIAEMVLDLSLLQKVTILDEEGDRDESRYDLPSALEQVLKNCAFSDSLPFIRSCFTYLDAQMKLPEGFTLKDRVNITKALVERNSDTLLFNGMMPIVLEKIMPHAEMPAVFANVVVELAQSKEDGAENWQSAMVFLAEGTELEFINEMKKLKATAPLPEPLEEWLVACDELKGCVVKDIKYSGHSLPEAPSISISKLGVLYKSFCDGRNANADIKFFEFLKNLEDKASLPGLVNKAAHPKEFAVQQEYLENLTKLITYEAHHLHKAMVKFDVSEADYAEIRRVPISKLTASEANYIELSDLLYSTFHSMEEMSKWCGGRYTENLPNVFLKLHQGRRSLLPEVQASYDEVYHAHSLSMQEGQNQKVIEKLYEYSFKAIRTAYQYFYEENKDQVQGDNYLQSEIHIFRALVKVMNERHDGFDFTKDEKGVDVCGMGDPLADQLMPFWNVDAPYTPKSITTALHPWSILRETEKIFNDSPFEEGSLRYLLVPLLDDKETVADLYYEETNKEGDSVYKIKSVYVVRYLKSIGQIALAHTA